MKKLPSEEKKHMNFYSEEAKTAELPNNSEYGFLYERNKKYMNNTAITFMGKEITYEELHTRIDEYARALYKRGVREGDVVAIGVANTPEAIYLQYALNKLGATTSPINPTYNDYKIARDLEIIQPKFYIGIRDINKKVNRAGKGLNIDKISYSPVASMGNKKIEMLYNLKQFITGNYSLNPDANLSHILKEGKYSGARFPSYEPGSVSDIMFTGGSSGLHKGVDLDGNGLNSVVRSLDYVFCLEPGEKMLGNLPQFMAFGKMSFHYALCKSLNLQLTLKAYPQDFVDELLRTECQGAMGGPIHWESLLNNSKLTSNSLKNLKMPITGGEQLKKEKEIQINEALESAGAPSRIWNGLGMTETWAPICVKRGELSDRTIGPMMPFMNAKIVNPETDEELGFEQTGMLHVSTPGMMLGYHNNKEETANSIYYDENGTRWFITGDLCKIRETGELEYVGRLKRCFVCGCDNIYPESIENLLCDIPGIREAVVTKIPDDEKQFLPKYHVSVIDENVSYKALEEKIKKTIMNTLGESAMPCDIEFYTKPLPRTPNAKIDPKPLQEKDLEDLKEVKRLKK